MSAIQLAQVLVEGAPFVVLGALIGAGYFLALRRNVEFYLSGRSLAAAVMLHLGRLLLVVAGFALIAPAGAVPLLAALLGFVLIRAVAVHARQVRW